MYLVTCMHIYIYIYFKINWSTKRDLYFFKNYLFHSYICVCFQLLLLSDNTCGTKQQTNMCELESHWVPPSYSLVPHMFSDISNSLKHSTYVRRK